MRVLPFGEVKQNLFASAPVREQKMNLPAHLNNAPA